LQKEEQETALICKEKLVAHQKLLDSISYPIGIFGGAVRSWLTGLSPRDIDIAVDCSQEELNTLVSKISPGSSLNRFGGYKVSQESGDYDLWALGETWAIKNAGVSPTFENLAVTASFNADCLVYTRDGLLDKGWEQARSSGILEINYLPNPYPFFNALRGIKMCNKYRLKPSELFKQYVKHNLPEFKVHGAAKLYREQYGSNLHSDMKVLDG